MRSLSRSLVLVALLSLSLAGIACGEDDSGSGDSKEAKALLERAFSKEVKSGELTLDLDADLEGGPGNLDKPIALKVAGPFEWGSTRKLPTLDWDVNFNGAGVNVKGGLIVTSDNAYVELQNQSYELGEEAFASLARQYASFQPGRPQSLGTFGLDPTDWMKDAKLEGDGESIGGDPTQKVTGSVDVRKAAVDIAELSKSPRLRQQLQRQGQPAPELPKPTDAELDQIEDAIDEFEIEANVDENGVLRRFLAEIDFDVPGERDGDDVKGGKVSVTYVLTKVDSEPDIQVPSNPKPIQELLEGFGLGGLGGGLGGP